MLLFHFRLHIKYEHNDIHYNHGGDDDGGVLFLFLFLLFLSDDYDDVSLRICTNLCC